MVATKDPSNHHGREEERKNHYLHVVVLLSVVCRTSWNDYRQEPFSVPTLTRLGPATVQLGSKRNKVVVKTSFFDERSIIDSLLTRITRSWRVTTTIPSAATTTR
eukprot:scaffold16111_cov172-Amphora_coffeaeformis.AAC.11